MTVGRYRIAEFLEPPGDRAAATRAVGVGPTTSAGRGVRIEVCPVGVANQRRDQPDERIRRAPGHADGAERGQGRLASDARCSPPAATGWPPSFTGINTKRIKFEVLLISGVVASFAGMLLRGRLQSGRFQWGAGDELSAIAAVILGGTSLFGGAGSVVGTLVGALLIGLINNGLILAGLDASQQQVIRGAIIILAVALARKK